MNFNKLSIAEKFGQMLLLGLDTYEINDEIINIIKEYKIGGVVLYKKNYTSLESMIEVINKLKMANSENKIPLFFAIDQENGVVNRLPKEVLNIYSPRKQSLANDENIPKAIGEITTYILKEVGINMNFAPVLDIDRYANDSIMGSRCYGKNKEEILKNTMPFMHFMQENNIIAVVKHFPGHGLNNKDSRLSIPVSTSIKKVEEDIKVFEEAINEGADAMMLDHLRIKGYGFNPVSMNKAFLEQYVFSQKYKGLLISDDLRMGIMPYIFRVKKSICKSIDAGCHIVMVKYKKGDLKKLYKPLFNKVKFCEIDPEVINNRAKVIIQMKEKYQVNNDIVKNNIALNKVNDKIKKINNLIDKKII